MRTLLYIIVLLVVTGCSYSASQLDRGLDEAEALMQSDPSAAMAKLNAYDLAEFDDSATMARWALLYSEALVANRLTAPTDTIVNIAINYYHRHNLREQYQLATELKALLKSPNGQPDALAEALYIQKEKEFIIYKERVKRQQAFFIGAIIFLIAATVIVWQRQRIRIKEAETATLIAEASTLMDGLSRNESIRSELQTKLSSLLSKRFDIIDQLCETYFEFQGTKTERRAIVEKVKSQIDGLKSDSGLFAEMEKSVNDCRNGLLENLREEWPALKPDDYRLAVYLACNLSNRSMALLLGESIDVVYKRKSRLKARLSASETPHSAQFLSIF
ncbi:MAG: hypothetical protein HDR85_09600 [Bacteroides sp.]|nr:hypothetical protein [Bacteroides sp.]